MVLIVLVVGDIVELVSELATNPTLSAPRNACDKIDGLHRVSLDRVRRCHAVGAALARVDSRRIIGVVFFHET